ncbi:minichromosome maintenance protein [Scheffersomyces coipomensis]|uniref:minichromosome maintenance protein n=1 Tax=Scheffersomyces coipomensis TaxID=1788519 RepID=UPI00315C582D
MIVGEVEDELRDIDNDIISLEAEIKQLKSEESFLLAELKKYELDNTKTKQSKEDPKYDTDIPAIIRHDHFDPSISKFFSQDVVESRIVKPKNGLSSSREPIDNSEVKENILYENILRMAGVTTFPLNNHVLGNSDNWLGLRFDIYSASSSKFVTPHYAILKKVKSENKAQELEESWSLHRHTLPQFLQLEELQKLLKDLEDGPRRFAFAIRRQLAKLQYKADKIAKLSSFNLGHFGVKSSKPIILKIDKDLQCQRIKLFIINRMSLTKKTHVIELSCTDEAVEFIQVDLTDVDSDTRNDILVCQSILKDTKFEDLFKNFRRLFEHLIQQQLI